MTTGSHIHLLQKAVRALKTNDPVMAGLVARFGDCTLRPHTDYYRELADAIIGQQVSVASAAAVVGRFATLGAGDFPTPAEVVVLDEERLRSVGLSRQKAGYIRDLAQHVVDGRLDLERLPRMTNEEIVAELTDVKGIGEWTAHMFLLFCLGRLDVLPTGDLGVRKGMMTLYDMDELPDPATMQQVAERNGWTGYESVASWYLWKSLDNAEKSAKL